MNMELKPAGHRYPSVILTEEELDSLLKLLSTEFEWNKNWIADYPALDAACYKLEMFEGDYQKYKKGASQ